MSAQVFLLPLYCTLRTRRHGGLQVTGPRDPPAAAAGACGLADPNHRGALYGGGLLGVNSSPWRRSALLDANACVVTAATARPSSSSGVAMAGEAECADAPAAAAANGGLCGEGGCGACGNGSHSLKGGGGGCCSPEDFGMAVPAEHGRSGPVPRVRRLQARSEARGEAETGEEEEEEEGAAAETGSPRGAGPRSSSSSASGRDAQRVEEEQQQQAPEDRFQWTSQWYPVFVAEHLDKRLPHPATVLGREFVVWWDRHGGRWQVFDDRCPHRLAPLSEGRIGEDGHLHCSYHGWAFAPDTGACSRIPQAPADRPTLKSSKKACATVYPSQVHQGMVWVWPDASEGAHERAAANPPPVAPELDDPDFVYGFLLADLGYSYDSLTENLLDPAHVPFAHHKIQSHRSQGRPMDLKVRGISKEGFVGVSTSRGPVQFQAPCLVTLRSTLPPRPVKPSRLGTLKKLLVGQGATDESSSKLGKLRKVALCFYCVPVAPGRSRLIAAIPRNFMKLVFHLTPRWVTHQNMMLLLVSDLYFLNIMERSIEHLGGNKIWAKTCYVPTGSDACVIAFRKWLQQFSGGRLDWGGKPDTLPPTPPKRQLLDRYDMHVGKCPHCSRALGLFRTAETGLLLLAFALLALIAAAASSPRSPLVLRTYSLSLAVLAVACFAMSKFLTRYIYRAFIFRDYVHGLIT